MSVTNTYVPVKVSGNGSKTAYDFTFTVYAASELQVYLVDKTTAVETLKTLNTDYTVTLDEVNGGGTVTFLAAPASTVWVLIRTAIPYEQTLAIQSLGAMRNDQVVQALDKTVRQIQQIAEANVRAMALPVSAIGVDGTISGALSAGSAIVVNATADGFALTETNLSDLDVALATAEAQAASATADAATATTQAGIATAAAASVPSTATFLASAYPVGSIYINAGVSTNPATYFGFGTWVPYGSGRVIVGLDSSQTEFDTLNETGGEKTHTLTTDELPDKYYANSLNAAASGGSTSSQSYTKGGGQAHNNLQPYIVAYMWRRTA